MELVMEELNEKQPAVGNTIPVAGSTGQNRCRKCGECCRRGGPALHSQDLHLIRQGKIALSSLITIRKGELVDNPLSGDVRPASVELVKILGTGNRWRCCYYDDEDGCTIYAFRPVGCSLLKCWDTRKILDIVEKDTLSRLDILNDNDPLAAQIKEHEQLCPCSDLERIRSNPEGFTTAQRDELELRVRRDLEFRSKVVKDFNLSLGEELFYFGRPLFQLLQPLGVKMIESAEGVTLIWQA